jgi:hypothetical protein
MIAVLVCEGYISDLWKIRFVFLIKTFLGIWIRNPSSWYEQQRVLVRERERERERREKVGEVVRDTTFKEGGGQEIFFSGFEGSQAVPARPSGRGMFERG